MGGFYGVGVRWGSWMGGFYGVGVRLREGGWVLWGGSEVGGVGWVDVMG